MAWLTRSKAYGAAGFLRLVLANGTLFELFKILEHATSEFRIGLLKEITPERAAALVDKVAFDN